MRLFIAVEASEEVKDYLKEIQNKIKKAGIRLTKGFHLTLRFVGEVPDEKVDHLKKSLSDMRYEPFKAKLNGMGYFPEEGKLRVAWVGLHPEDKIKELHEKVDDAVAKIGFQRDTRFKSHITVAKVKFMKNKREFKDKILSINVKPMDFMIDKIKLIKSTATDTGHVYDTIAEF